MKAVRFLEVGRPAEIVDLPKPTPAPGEVLVRIAGAGVCHSDLHVLDEGIGIAGPFTLGHENAGWIAALGEGVTGWKEGDPVAVYGPWGCGACHTCPNIFAGEHSFHSRLEWVSVRDMESAVRTIVHLAAIWEEKA